MLALGGERSETTSGTEKMMCGVTRAKDQAVNQFRTIVREIMTTSTNCSRFESSPAATSAAAELLRVTSLIVGRRHAVELNSKGRPRLPRQEIIRRSMELLKQRVGEPVQLGELVAAAEVSERTLRTAFKEYFGVGPVSYLQLRQLHQVHRELREADPETLTVARVLVDHGVWAFSRFASRYRRLFNELPSATLRKKRR
jgi:AraC family ethanolamine operon transcriptional activator